MSIYLTQKLLVLSAKKELITPMLIYVHISYTTRMLHGNKNFVFYNILSVIYMIEVTPASVKTQCKLYIFPSSLSWQNSPLLGQGFPIVDALPSHSDTPHLIGPLSTSDQPVAETSNRQHTIHTTDIHSPDRIRTHNPCMQANANPRLRPRSH